MICSVTRPSHSGQSHGFICSSLKPTVQETVSPATQMILIHTLFQQLWKNKEFYGCPLLTLPQKDVEERFPISKS